MLNTLMENENTNFANILIPFLRPCSQHLFQEKNRNISKICVFIFHHSIQDDEASGYVFIMGAIFITKRNCNVCSRNIEKDEHKFLITKVK